MKMDMFEAKTQVAKALAHPLRLAICEYLLNIKEPKCVNHLANHFKKNQSVISKHLSILQQVNIVTLKKEGIYNRYTLSNPAQIRCIIDAINSIVRENALKNSKIVEMMD